MNEIAMSQGRRKFPRVPLQGEVSLQIAGIIRSADLMDISPSGLQVECRHQLIEHLSGFKSDAGLFPNFELQFKLENGKGQAINSICNVSYCRRLSQDKYHLGLKFVSLAEADEARILDFIDQAAAA